MKLFKLAAKSAWNRKTSLSLAMISIAISIFLLMGVDKIRKEAKNTFLNTISQTDLIVGARSGPINLLLYSVFRIGNATNNVSYASYQDIIKMKSVKWSVPISLGDSHRGFRVMGTTQDFFRHYQYADSQQLKFLSGSAFNHIYDAVIGYDVAHQLKYSLGKQIILSHGIVSTKFSEHDDKPFRIVGILKKTGTPVDRTIHVSLSGIEAIHIGWQSGSRSSLSISAEQTQESSLKPKSITAFMLGLERKIDTFRLQRKINQFNKEPLLAIVPGSTLANLWQMVGSFEKILMTISTLVLLSGLMGLLTTLLSTLNERRREMAVLRAVGAHPYHIMILFSLEALFVVSSGCFFGVLSLYLIQILIQPLITELYGLHLAINFLDSEQFVILIIAVFLSLLLSLIPGYIAYKQSLTDGLTVKF